MNAAVDSGLGATLIFVGPSGGRRVQVAGSIRLGGTLAFVLFSCGVGLASTVCPAERAKPLQPTDRTLCAEFARSVRNPRALPLDEYQAKLAQFLRNYCHRDEASGWLPDGREALRPRPFAEIVTAAVRPHLSRVTPQRRAHLAQNFSQNT